MHVVVAYSNAKVIAKAICIMMELGLSRKGLFSML
jgi:hypothetical protein